MTIIEVAVLESKCHNCLLETSYLEPQITLVVIESKLLWWSFFFSLQKRGKTHRFCPISHVDIGYVTDDGRNPAPPSMYETL